MTAAAETAPPRGDGDRDVPVLMARLERRLTLEASEPPVEAPDGFRLDAKGRLVPDRLVDPAHELEDAVVRRILAFAVDLADQIARFRAHCYADVAALLDVLAEKYGARKRGRKGNFTLRSYDGRLKVAIQIADRMVFGPGLQVARRISEELIAEWSDGTRPEVAALLQGAFEPDKEGHISREMVFRLRRIDIDDERWRRFQQAIDEAVQIVGTKSYVRFYLRGSAEDAWKAVPIDISAEWTETARLAAVAVRTGEAAA